MPYKRSLIKIKRKEIIRSNLTKFVISILITISFIACTKKILTISIKSDPKGAKVNDLYRKELGVTDLEYKVKKGESLNLTFSKSGYKEEKKDLNNISRNETIMVELHSFPTFLYIETIPPGATFKVFNKEVNNYISPVDFSDGRIYNTTLFSTKKRYQIPDDLEEVVLELSNKGCKEVRKMIKIEPFEENRFLIHMEKFSLQLHIKSMPNGVEVFERELGFLGRTPLKKKLDWEQLRKLSQVDDAVVISEVTLHLFFKKNGYKTKEQSQIFSISKSPYQIKIDLEVEGNK